MARLIATLIVILFVNNIAFAEVVTKPLDLTPGDQYRLVFVTGSTFSASSADATVYDAAVTAQAAMSPELLLLGTNWNAIVSTPTANARDLTGTVPGTDGTGIPIYNLAGQRVEASYQGLWSGLLSGIENPIRYNQFGAVPIVPTDKVWTGTDEFGMISNGGLGSGGISTQGQFGRDSSQWISGSTSSNPFRAAHLYGISGTLTVTAIPEPSYALLLGLFAGTTLSFRRKRKSLPHVGNI